MWETSERKKGEENNSIPHYFVQCVPQTSGVPHDASHTDDQQESQDAKENISYPHDNNEVEGEV